MTVLNEEDGARLLASLPDPQYCDVCDVPFDDSNRRKLPYGPFQVHLCPSCAEKFSARRKRGKTALIVL